MPLSTTYFFSKILLYNEGVKLMSIKDAAERLNMSATRLREHCQKGRLGTKIGRTWVITSDELERFRQQERRRGRPRKTTS